MPDVFTCVKCGETLPLDNFQKCTDRKSGHLPSCRKCMNAYTAMMRTKKRNENIEEARRKEREYHRRAREKLAKNNPEALEKLLAKKREWYWKNREKVLEGYKIISDDDPELDLVPLSGGWGEWNLITRGVQ